MHTPGPWHIGEIKWEDAPEILDDKMNLIGTVARAQYADNHEAQDNARLIAAAPELLAAMQEASRALTELDPDSEHHDPDVIDDALRKARGG